MDGKSIGSVGVYTFTNVKANHTIEATFRRTVAETTAPTTEPTTAPTETTVPTTEATVPETTQPEAQPAKKHGIPIIVPILLVVLAGLRHRRCGVHLQAIRSGVNNQAAAAMNEPQRPSFIRLYALTAS